MKRGKPLRRKTPLRRRSKTKKYRRRMRDTAYMLDVKKLSCVVRELPEFQVRLDIIGVIAYAVVTTCEGRVQADHAGTRGLGQKASDDTVIPVCKKHHGERTDYRGTFKHWTAPMMRAFNDWAIERTQREVAGVSSRRR